MLKKCIGFCEGHNRTLLTMCKVLETLAKQNDGIEEEKGSWRCFVNLGGFALAPTILTIGMFMYAIATKIRLHSSPDGSEGSAGGTGHRSISPWCDENAWQYQVLMRLPGTALGWWMSPALLKATYRKEFGALFFLLAMLGAGLWLLYKVRQVEMGMCASGTA